MGRGRIVSILGAGGVGKTSIALQIGANVLQRYEDGVWLVELAPLSDAASPSRRRSRACCASPRKVDRRWSR